MILHCGTFFRLDRLGAAVLRRQRRHVAVEQDAERLVHLRGGASTVTLRRPAWLLITLMPCATANAATALGIDGQIHERQRIHPVKGSDASRVASPANAPGPGAASCLGAGKQQGDSENFGSAKWLDKPCAAQ